MVAILKTKTKNPKNVMILNDATYSQKKTFRVFPNPKIIVNLIYLERAINIIIYI